MLVRVKKVCCSFLFQDFSQYRYSDKTGYCLLILFYEEIFKCTSASKMHQLYFSKKSVKNNGRWLKALVRFLLVYRWPNATVNMAGLILS